MTELFTHTEQNDSLANWLGVESVALVREDLLPNGGGKKRRALQDFSDGLNQINHLHLLSYAGSHTAFSMAQLQPELMVHLYGSHYGGGDYERAMIKQLNNLPNMDQAVGSSLSMARKFYTNRMLAKNGHHFMKIGGSLDVDRQTDKAVSQVVETLENEYHHFVAVASGNLLSAIHDQTEHVTGILTQPKAIRILKALSLKRARGLKQESLGKRMRMMRDIQDLTGALWDPIFMGTVFSYLKRQKQLPNRLCIWVTCPTGIDWIASED